MNIGEVVYETLDGGLMPARVVAVLAKSDQLLVKLAPDLSQSSLRNDNPDHYGRRGYIVFRHSSLSRYPTAADIGRHIQ